MLRESGAGLICNQEVALLVNSQDPGRRAQVFAALGDPTRLHLLERLSASQLASITALTADAGMSRQAVTKHLHVLAQAGLVADRPQGRERIYRAVPEALADVEAWISEYRRSWEESLDRLDEYLKTLQNLEQKP